MEGTRLREIKSLVKKYNQAEKGLYLTEASLHQIFDPGEELTVQNLPLRLWIVNGLWSAGIQRHREHMHKIFEKLRDDLTSVNASIDEVRDFDYCNDDVELLWRAIPHTFSLVYGAANHYPVFAAKFFHWCAPRAFPIIDGNAQRAIRRFQDLNDWPRGKKLPKSGRLTTKHYKNLIYFYKEFIVEMVEKHNVDIDKLIQWDYDTQPAGFQYKNTILRVLDKYFWMKGQEEG